MISDSLSCLGRYLGIHPALDTAIRWLGANDLNALPTGCTEVDGRTVYINVMEAGLRPAEGADFEYHRLYADLQKDDAVASAFCDAAGYPWEDAAPFVLEGGSIHTDGEGTALVTESCLLSAGRNPSLSRQEIEAELCRRLGVRKVLWLPRGIYNDETNEHVDNVCAFVGPAEVVLAWTDDPSDPQYPLSAADLAYLQSVTDAQGRRLKIHKLPIPDHPILCSEADCDAYEFAPGEDTREPGERLAASYVKF